MLSDWTGDQINPAFDKDTFSHEFEIFGVEASRQTVPRIQRLIGEVMVKKFVDNVSSLRQLPPIWQDLFTNLLLTAVGCKTEALPEEFGRMRIMYAYYPVPERVL